MRTPAGARYERQTPSGRFIEFTHKPLADGSLLGLFRDITQLKERELAQAAAKEAAESAAAAAERERAEAQLAIRQRKAEEAFQAWVREIRDRAYVEIRLDDK